jgi:hypothetical protein
MCCAASPGSVDTPELALTPGAKQEAVIQVFKTLKAGQIFAIVELERLCKEGVKRWRQTQRQRQL